MKRVISLLGVFGLAGTVSLTFAFDAVGRVP